MLAKRGGYATQQSYRVAGRVGPTHPAHRAASVSASRREWRTQERAEVLERERLGSTPKHRWKRLPLG